MNFDNTVKKEIIVTGGAGFIGIHLTARLISDGYFPIIIDNMSNANMAVLNKFSQGSYKLICKDINDYVGVKRELLPFNPECIVHLAALHYIPFCIENPAKTKEVNINGTESVLKIAKEKSIRRFIFSSSAAVYRPSDKMHRETDITEAIDVYGRTKLVCEDMIKKDCQDNDMSFVILRFFNIYGNYDMTPHFIPSIMGKMEKAELIEVGNLNTERDYVFIEDLIDLLLDIVKRRSLPSDIYNVGTGIGTSGEDVFDMIRKIHGFKRRALVKKDLLRKNDRKRLVANNEKVSEAFNWKPRYNLREGLESMLKK